ncbi:MAG: glycine-rich domain-containing protein [Candidatus Roizmanbacteria bacterium]
MFHHIFDSYNRRVIIALVLVSIILAAFGYLVMTIRQSTLARIPAKPPSSGLTLVTATATTDVQVTLESDIASLPATGTEVPVKIMVSKPSDLILSDLAVNLKYDPTQFTLARFEADPSCDLMQRVSPTPSAIPAPSSGPTITATPPFSATGGDITTSGGYRIHTFISSTTLKTFTPNAAATVEVLVVGGGGGGGKINGGGGGAGGFISNTVTAVTSTAYPVVVGQGGAANGGKGGDSSFADITAAGGGGGGVAGDGWVGGSGGGAAGGGHAGGLGNTPNVAPAQGNNGGLGTLVYAANPGGGGGGAVGVGVDGVSTTAGNGGQGRSSDMSGTIMNYAGGGGGGIQIGTAGSGRDGGGNGGVNGPGTPGTDNTGGGGGSGGGSFAASDGGKGGSGIVIIRYLYNGPAAASLPSQLAEASGQALHGDVLGASTGIEIVYATKKTTGDTQAGLTTFCLAKAIMQIKSAGFTTGQVQVVASGADTQMVTTPVSTATMAAVTGQDIVDVTKTDSGTYTISSPAYDIRMTGTVALTIKKPVDQIKRGDEFYIDIMAKPVVPSGVPAGISALQFDFGYGAVLGSDGIPTSKVLITSFDTTQTPTCNILDHVLPSTTTGYNIASQRPYITYSKAGHTTFPSTDFCVGRIYMKAMETGLVTMSIKADGGIAIDARGRQVPIQSTDGSASTLTLDVVPSTVVDPSCEDLKLNVDTNGQNTYIRPQQAVIISMNQGLAYKILADKGTGITLKNPPKRFTYTAPAAEGTDRIQIWRTDNTYCEPEVNIQSNENGPVSSLDGVYIDPNKVSVRMKIRPQGVIKGRLPYTKLKVAVSAGGLPTNNNLIDPVSNEFISIGDGVFEGIVTFDPRYIKPGKGYKLVVKGSKHLAKRICEPEPNKSKSKPDNAYVCSKDNMGIFDFRNGLNGPYDFTKVYLPAGDLFITRQDGVIDSTDLTYIRKNLGTQDPELLRIGDLNMDGQIDTQDYLMTISNVVNNLDED